MSEEFQRFRFRPGWIEVIVGCMFSGKTEELIKQIRRAEYARQKIQVFKPRIDNRYSEENIASHSRRQIPSKVVDSAEMLLAHVERSTDVVGIDEGQFFGPELTDIATTLANAGKRVIIAGLDTDWRGRPFGPMPDLMAIAEVVRKQYAICMVCGDLANRTQRLVSADGDILVGSSEAYEARCRTHFDPELGARLKLDKSNAQWQDRALS